MSKARFEIVRTDADQPWHARFVAGNGRIVWTTETYTRRGRALAAIDSVLAITYGRVEDGSVVCLSSRDSWNKTNQPVAEVRDVDERAS